MHSEARSARAQDVGSHAGPGRSRSGPDAGRGPSTAYLLAGLTILAFALRFLRLGHWGFDSDEIFMLRDSLHPRLTNPRPLLYYINHLLSSVVPLDEFGLRLLPAIFGALAVPAFYLVGRRLIGARAALFGALLLTVSGLHVFYSQFGRYWSLVFLLTAVYPYAIYIGVRQRNTRALALGIVAGVLASAAHPVSVLLVGGPALWFLATYLRPSNLRVLWSRTSFRWGALILFAVLAAIAVRFVPILHSWVSSHDANPGSGQFLLRAPVPLGVKQFLLLLAYVQGWSLSLFLAATVGIYLLWKEYDRDLGLFLASLVLFPVVFITLTSTRTPVSVYYLIPIAPVFFYGAGFFLDWLFDIDWRVRPRWLLPSTVLLMMLIDGAPMLVSQFLNGRRYDFKNTAVYLRPRLTPGDVIFSDQPVVLGYYLPQREVQRLRYDTAPLAEAVATVRRAGPAAALWIIAPSPGHALRTNLRQGGLADWIYDNCQLRNSVGMGRVDFREQYLQVYRCPPAVPSGGSN